MQEEPYFSSLEELVEHVRDKDIGYILPVFHHEYEALRFLQTLPIRKRNADPLVAYEEDLGFVWHYLNGKFVQVESKKRRCALVHQMLDGIGPLRNAKKPLKLN